MSLPLRVAAGLVVLVLILLVVGSAHAYLDWRLIQQPELPSPVRLGLRGLLWAGAALVFLQPLVERTLRPPWARVVTWPAALWMGLFFLLFVATVLSEGVALLGSGAASLGGLEWDLDSLGARRLRAGLVAAAVVPAAVLALRSGLGEPAHRRVEIELAQWPRALDGYRVVQISDIHIGPILGKRFAAELVRRVNALQPDCVAVTGDLVDGHVALVAEEAAPFAGLRGRDGVYFVTGNHDHYSGASDWSEQARSYGWHVLRNEHLRIERDGAWLNVVGVDDHRSRHMFEDEGEDLERAFAEVDASLPTLLLAHDPSTFKRAHALGVDLQLSGHTHGGQIWPFGYAVRLAIPFVAGRYRRGEAELYVSRGTGFWGPPMRLGAPAELTELVLRAAPGTGS